MRIELTRCNGDKTRVQTDLIAFVERVRPPHDREGLIEYTCVAFAEGWSIDVRETPEEIDAIEGTAREARR